MNKIIFYHNNNNNLINIPKCYSNNIILKYYEELDFYQIKISSLIFNDKYKYLNLSYNYNCFFIKLNNININDLKLFFNENIINLQSINKDINLYNTNNNKNYIIIDIIDDLYNDMVLFINMIEKYIFNIVIKELKNWYIDHKYFYNSIINDNKLLINFYNNLKIINNNNKNKISNIVNLLFKIYSINIINDKNNNIYLNLYIKLISIEI